MFKSGIIHRSTFVLLLLLFTSVTALGQSSVFSYQGRLTDNGNPADGLFDMQFKLFNTATVGTGTQFGTTISQTLQVTNGAFSVQLDFGACPACFDGAARFLEIGLRPTGSPAHYTLLGPRQPIASAPYAVRSLAAAAADSLSVACVNCVTSSQIQNVQGGQVNGAIPVASVPAGSANYIQNATIQQAGSNFNISGNGTAGGALSANEVNATTQYNIGGFRVLSVVGGSNLFTGINAGTSNSGHSNAFFGPGAGFSNTTGSENSFSGRSAGSNNTSGSLNSFFGRMAGRNNATGSNNTFIGSLADFNTSNSNPTGDNNTLLGAIASVISGISNAAAIGSRAQVEQSNSLVLGSISGVNDCTPITDCESVNVGIGTTTPSASLHVSRTTSSITTPVAILGSPGTQIPLAFKRGSTEVARIRADSSGNLVLATLSGTDKDIYFRAGDDSSTDVFIESSTGNVGIGDTTPVDKLDVEGDIRVGTGTTGCVKDANASVIAGTCSSDARLKRSITAFPETLDKLIKLRPVHFYWRADEYKDRAFGAAQSFGLIAQEVERVLPELVTQDEQGLKAVRYNKLPLLMLQAVKELKAEKDEEIAALKVENNKLKQQLKQQEERLRRLEAAMSKVGGKN